MQFQSILNTEVCSFSYYMYHLLCNLQILIHIGTMKFTYMYINNVFFEYNHFSPTTLKESFFDIGLMVIIQNHFKPRTVFPRLVSNYCSNHRYNISIAKKRTYIMCVLIYVDLPLLVTAVHASSTDHDIHLFSHNCH